VSGFDLFQDLLKHTDNLLNSFVNEAAGNAIATITPFVVVAFTITLLWYAYKVMFGQLDMPVSRLITKCLTWSIVMSLALTVGVYQNHIAKIIRDLPNDVATAVAPGQSNLEGSLGSLIDHIFDTGLSKAKAAFTAPTDLFDFGHALLYKGIGFGILLWTLALTVTGFIMLMMATVAVSFLSALGPFFIAAYMFDSTRVFFGLWINQVLYWVVYMMLFALCATYIMSMYQSYLDAVEVGVEAWLPTIASINIVSIFAMFIFFWIPRVASALTGGGGQSMLGTISTVVSAAADAISLIPSSGKLASSGTAKRDPPPSSSTGAKAMKLLTYQPSKGHARK